MKVPASTNSKAPVTILEILTLSSVRVTETSTVGQRLGRLTFQADEYIRQALLAPGAFVVPSFSSIMPKFSFFTDAQILALTESLKSP